ncbi:MAG: 16S rRNA processing protein RimM [Clostridia bacterium]|nr:16S rRNA processing protein RimM [Clostridia bacterium]
MNDKDVLEIGQIVNTRGLRGEVKVNSFSEDPERFEKLNSILVKEKNEYKEYEIQKVAYAKNQVILKLKGIDHIDYAEKLRGLYVYILRSELGDLPEGKYYIADLIGLKVYEDNGKLLGTVDDVFNTKSNSVYVVRTEKGELKYLPGIPDVIKNVDLDNQKITVTLIPGL